MSITATVQNGKLVITCDIPAHLSECAVSKTGKSKIVASTQGNVSVGTFDGKPLVLGLNAYCKS